MKKKQSKYNSILGIPTYYQALYHNEEHHSSGDASVQ